MIKSIINAAISLIQMIIDGFVSLMSWIINIIPTPQACIDSLPAIPIPVIQMVNWAIPVPWIVTLLKCYIMSIITYFSVKAFLRWL